MTEPGAAVAVLDPYTVDLERFRGPLDLLLHLVRKQDLDIFDIPIARITEQFLAIVRGTDHLELDRAGEFLEMAAILIRIKAQMLFPRAADAEEQEDPRADLVRRLLEYEHFSEAARLLDRAEREQARHFGRGYASPHPPRPASDLPLNTTWDEVLQAALGLAARREEPEPGYRFRSRPVRIDEKIDLVLRRLSGSPRVEFRTLVAPWGTRMHTVVSLLACLELAKRNLLRVRQRAPFATLWLYRASRAPAG